MAWDLETAKKYLGLEGDDSKDAIIQLTMDRTLASIEKLLGRNLLLQRSDIVVPCVRPPFLIQFDRYPIVDIHSVVPDGNRCVVEAQGTVQLLDGVGPGDTVTFDIEAGYDPVPDDLDWAMWSAFLALWNSTDQTTGGPPADGSGTVTPGGEVKDITVFDGFKISYSTTTTSTDDSAGASDEEAWGWLAPWAPILNQYRSGPAGAGLGIA